MKRSKDSIRTGRLKLSTGTLFWHEVGQGQTVVFLHGNWQEGTQWLPLFPALGDDFHCLAPDLLGFGESSGERGTAYSIQLQVESLAAFLQALRISRCCLVGHQLGAWVAAQFALQYPDQVQSLVLIEPEGLTPTLDRRRWGRHRQVARRFSPFVASLRVVAPLIKLLGGQAWLQQVFTLRRQLQQFPAACRILFQRKAAEINAELVQDQVARLTLPVHLLEPDPQTPLHEAFSKALIRALPAASLTTLPQDNTPWGMALEPTAAVLTTGLKATYLAR